MSSALYVTIAGRAWVLSHSAEAGTIDAGSLTITDVLNQVQNTCGFTCRGVKPAVGQEVIVALDSPEEVRLFGGTIVSVQRGYVGTPANMIYQVQAVTVRWGWAAGWSAGTTPGPRRTSRRR